MNVLTLRSLMLLSICGLVACSPHDKKPADKGPPPVSASAEAVASMESGSDAVSSISSPVALGPISCASEIGNRAAEKRAQICIQVSPATHPPCNVANSCAMIEDEIARSCALFDGQSAPMPQCQPAPQSQAAAVAVVTRYYAALNARDYETAWQQWGENGPSNQTLTAFTAGFAHTQSTQVTIGKLEPSEGGAGSIYQTVPVTVDATLDDGKHQRFTGEYIVRRVNGVDGATRTQLRWHIGSAHLVSVPVG